MKQIAYSKAALKSLRRIPANAARRIREKIEQYAADPASQANNVIALQAAAASGSGLVTGALSWMTKATCWTFSKLDRAAAFTTEGDRYESDGHHPPRRVRPPP